MTLAESVTMFHEAVATVEATLRMPMPYDFVRDPHKVAARFENAFRALKAAAQQSMQGATLRTDVQAMLAECANNYRNYGRQMSAAREPKEVARRKKTVKDLRRHAAIDAFAVAEVAAFWETDARSR